MKSTTIILLLLLVTSLSAMLFLVFSATKSVAAQSVNVTVNVSMVAQMNILPTWLVWNLTTPGTDAGNKTIDVKNSGSLNLTDIYAFANTNETEQTNPLDTGISTRYSSGGLIAMANDTLFTFYFVGRQEWNISYTPTGASLTAYGGGITNRSVGYFRNTSSEYLWQLTNGTTTVGGMCNATGAVLRISANADTGDPSTRDLAITSSNYVQGTLTASTGQPWAVFTFASGAWQNYCAAAYWDCTKIYIYKYDYRSGIFSTGCSQRNYLLSGGSSLKPGQVRVWNLRAWIPYGIPAGNTTSAVISIIGTASVT